MNQETSTKLAKGKEDDEDFGEILLVSYKAVRHRYSNPMIQPKPEGSTQGYPLVSVEVLRYDTKGEKVRIGNNADEMELTLEQTQQGVSYEVSVLSDIKDNHGPSDALHNPPKPLKVSQQTLVSFLTEITCISVDLLTPKHAEFDKSDTYVLERFDTSVGNPVKEILLKLNLPDHRSILTDSKMEVKVPDSS
ncbi:hypothetical protein Tco_0282009 [Tanacetum coccineum]